MVSERSDGRVLRLLKQYLVMDFVMRMIIRGIYHLDYL
jgi:hypothetical protein